MAGDCYPERNPGRVVEPLPFAHFTAGITGRGMDTFTADGPHIVVDTTDFEKVDKEKLLREILSILRNN